MKTRILRLAPWILLNLLAMIAYLYFGSAVWAPKGEEGLLGGPGDPIIWTLTAFPFLVISGILDLAWLVLILKRRARDPNWYPITIWLIVIVAWWGVFSYDSSRQYTGNAVPHAFAPQSPPSR